MSHFHKLFPEVTESNQTGKLSKDAFALWEESKNSVNIEMDTGNGTSLPKYDVYIGGPASAVAAAMQAKSGTFFKVNGFTFLNLDTFFLCQVTMKNEKCHAY